MTDLEWFFIGVLTGELSIFGASVLFGMFYQINNKSRLKNLKEQAAPVEMQSPKINVNDVI